MIFIGLDDTDNQESRGTGRLARAIAASLPVGARLMGVIRHQLLVDERIPMTSHNSCAAICVDGGDKLELFDLVKGMMLADFQTGSDPGLCVADEQAAKQLTEFGLLAQREVVQQAAARRLAEQAGVLLAGLGGSQDGVIGALAAVGLAAVGNDGRYILIGQSRELSGLQPVQAVLAAGIADIRTIDNQPVRKGMILTDRLRPARRGGQPVLFVQQAQEHWEPLKLDH